MKLFLGVLFLFCFFISCGHCEDCIEGEVACPQTCDDGNEKTLDYCYYIIDSETGDKSLDCFYEDISDEPIECWIDSDCKDSIYGKCNQNFCSACILNTIIGNIPPHNEACFYESFDKGKFNRYFFGH